MVAQLLSTGNLRMADYSTTRYSKRYSLRTANISRISVLNGRGLPQTHFFRFLAEQIAKIRQSTGILMRVKRANRNAGGHARQTFKFFRAHAAIKGIGSKRVGHQREKRPLRREFFNQRGGIAASLAQNINCGQWQGSFCESQFLFTQ